MQDLVAELRSFRTYSSIAKFGTGYYLVGPCWGLARGFLGLQPYQRPSEALPRP
jgi:hypothetical protein